MTVSRTENVITDTSAVKPSSNILDTTSTLTTTMLEGMKETVGLDYDIRFSVGIVLMAVILLTNLILNTIKKKVGHVHVK